MTRNPHCCPTDPHPQGIVGLLCYAMFDPYPTRWSLLMEDFVLVVCSALAVMMLSVLATWLMTILLLIALPATYLPGILHPVIRKIALLSPTNNVFPYKRYVSAAFLFETVQYWTAIHP